VCSFVAAAQAELAAIQRAFHDVALTWLIHRRMTTPPVGHPSPDGVRTPSAVTCQRSCGHILDVPKGTVEPFRHDHW
jgi:hypothetical protein